MNSSLNTIDLSALNTVIGGRGGGFAAPRPAPRTVVINRTTTVMAPAPAAGGGFLSNMLSTAGGTAAGVAIGNYLTRPAAPAPAAAAPAPAATAPAPAAAA